MAFGLKSITLLAAAAVATLSSSVQAHGYISYPAATFKDNTIATTYNARFNATQTRAAFKGLKWDDSPDNNLATFTKAFKASGYKSLRAMVNGFVPTCGNSRTDVTAKSVKGYTSMKWQNDQEGVGFIKSHSGPCEVWIGDKRVLQSDDCRTTYPTYPAVLPVNYAYCKTTTCTLMFYWLALHEPMWQIYKQCVPITTK